MMLAGLALMGAGGWLLWAALRGRAGRLARQRTRRHGRRAVASVRPRPPRIRRSSLLDPTVNLNPVPVLDPISGRQVFVVPRPPMRLRTPRAPNPARFGAPYGSPGTTTRPNEGPEPGVRDQSARDQAGRGTMMR